MGSSPRNREQPLRRLQARRGISQGFSADRASLPRAVRSDRTDGQREAESGAPASLAVPLGGIVPFPRHGAAGAGLFLLFLVCLLVYFSKTNDGLVRGSPGNASVRDPTRQGERLRGRRLPGPRRAGMGTSAALGTSAAPGTSAGASGRRGTPSLSLKL